MTWPVKLGKASSNHYKIMKEKKIIETYRLHNAAGNVCNNIYSLYIDYLN